MIVAVALGVRVAFEDGAWRALNRPSLIEPATVTELVALLQGASDQAARELSEAAAPDPDRQVAEAALLRLGGRIVSLQGHRGAESVPQRIY